ncbi:GroES-like protein [Peniophora sp. CONT]|nr:GroES-like protein [Peniophora sp. CONT]
MSLPSQQKALVLPAVGPGKTFELGTRAVPHPGPGQVLIRNEAVALNPVDWIIRNYGVFVSAHGWPAVVGNDGAGKIVALGSDVQGWAVGDTVLYQCFWSPDRGTFQEYTIADAVRIARVPTNISVEEAATVPLGLGTAAIALYNAPSATCAGFTAPWEADGAGKYVGQAALVIGGSSSVGQYGKFIHPTSTTLSGFSPIITTASARNEVYCKKAGATHVIDYNAVPYSTLPDKVAEILDGAPLIVAYDAISLPDSQKAAWAALAPRGTLVVVLEPAVGGTPGTEAEQGKKMVRAYGMANEGENLEFSARMYSVIPSLLERGDLKPNKVEILQGGLAGIPAGLERLEAKKVSGVKLVARVAETL